MTDGPRIASRRTRILVTAAVFLAHLIFAFLIDPDETTSNSASEVLGACLFGVWLSQLLILAALAALGPFPMLKQIPTAAIGVLLLAAVDGTHSPQDASAIIAEVLALSGVFSLLLVPLLLARWLRGLRIALLTAGRTAPRNQFSVQWLFLITLAAGLTFAVLHYVLQRRVEPLNSHLLWEIVGFVAVITLLFLGVLLTVGLVLADSGRSRLAVACLLLIPLGCCLSTEFAVRLDPGDSFQKEFWQFAALQCGAIISIVLTLLPFRWCGYRLVRRDRSAGAGEMPETA